MKLYADISKTEPQDDGTLKVWGYASSGAKDSDGETITADAMKAAIPDYMKFGAVREMHGSSAAGTAIEIAVDEVGKTTFGAHIVDPIAVKKISHGVYKGFSIGGKATSRDPVNKTIITGLKLVEVSLVDRPANPDAVFTMFKAEKSTEEVADLEKAAIAGIAELLNTKAILPSQILKAASDSLVKVAPRAKLIPANVQKGMSGVSQFASLLQSIGWLASDSASEASWEGDDSALPQSLRDWLASGVSIFQAMAEEETKELVAALTPAVETDPTVIAMAAAAELKKAGAQFSAKTKAALADVHASAQTVCDKMTALGYQDAPEDDAAKAAAVELAKADELAKAALADDLTRAKAVVISDAAVQAELLAKVAQTDLMKTELAKRDDLITKLSARLEVLEAQPMPGKALLKAIAKGDDVTSETTDSELPKDATPEMRALDGIKKAFRTGGRLVA